MSHKSDFKMSGCLEIAEKLVRQETGKSLSCQQEIILTKLFKDSRVTYDLMAIDSGYAAKTLKNTASELWQVFSRQLKIEVSKGTFKSALEKAWRDINLKADHRPLSYSNAANSPEKTLTGDKNGCLVGDLGNDLLSSYPNQILQTSHTISDDPSHLWNFSTDQNVLDVGLFKGLSCLGSTSTIYRFPCLIQPIGSEAIPIESAIVLDNTGTSISKAPFDSAMIEFPVHHAHSL